MFGVEVNLLLYVLPGVSFSLTISHWDECISARCHELMKWMSIESVSVICIFDCGWGIPLKEDSISIVLDGSSADYTKMLMMFIWGRWAITFVHVQLFGSWCCQPPFRWWFCNIFFLIGAQRTLFHVFCILLLYYDEQFHICDVHILNDGAKYVCCEDGHELAQDCTSQQLH